MEDPLADLFPTVGMMSRNEIISVNFGQKPFKFDIDTYVRNNQNWSGNFNIISEPILLNA